MLTERHPSIDAWTTNYRGQRFTLTPTGQLHPTERPTMNTIAEVIDAPPAPSKRIVWTCQHCHGPIADGSGWITICQREVWQRRQAVKAWEKAQHEAAKESRDESTGRIGRLLCAADIMGYPDPVRWERTHEACDPNPDRGSDYWIAIERIRTEADVLSWSAHLFEKRWFQDTAWDRIIRAAIGRHHL